ncbi:hypothetical protein AAKU64_004049 [Undibacterium sp. GrIS 1.8]|uniref:hypothetical protein n=1 Tax=Undibacterium sp. GrIS 1.8 TaxID=3143934 RepID=UPI003394EF1B
MDQDSSAAIPSDITSLGGKSWTAYIRVIAIGFVLFCIVTPLAWRASVVAGIVVLLLSLGFTAYQFLELRSYHLYFNDIGVWIYSGVLPWKKGVAGVKWRDLDEAVYFQSIGSWLFKSYSIRIGHRFTKSSEILVSHMTRGNEVVMKINGRHQDLVRANALN